MLFTELLFQRLELVHLALLFQLLCESSYLFLQPFSLLYEHPQLLLQIVSLDSHCVL